jgi:hypothetical protein
MGSVRCAGTARTGAAWPGAGGIRFGVVDNRLCLPPGGAAATAYGQGDAGVGSSRNPNEAALRARPRTVRSRWAASYSDCS